MRKCIQMFVENNNFLFFLKKHSFKYFMSMSVYLNVLYTMICTLGTQGGKRHQVPWN